MILSVFFTFILTSYQCFAADPFADVFPKSNLENQTRETSWPDLFFSENFGFRKEIMSQFSTVGTGHSASRQSIGFETLKKFSTETKTFLGVDIQGRFVRRDGFVGTVNDGEGMDRPNWSFEYHNLYADFYDPFGGVGQFNFRIGRFYLPFGLNLQTDTHGSILQLSNERNFGFERDWYTGFWGILSEDLRYDIYYLLGSGYDIESQGQSGLGSLRVSLANKYLSEYGLEGGVSLLSGERIDSEATIINTFRAGVDARYRNSISNGLVTWTSEISAGHDNSDAVVTQLHQVDYLPSSRRWGIATQYRKYWQDMSADGVILAVNAPSSTDSSILVDATWYFRNDVGNSNLQWLKLNCENQIARQTGDKDVIWTIQYYQYW